MRANHIASLEASGKPPEAIAEAKAAMEKLLKSYENPVFRLAITMTEIFPVGLVIALIAAALFRNPRFLPASS